MTEMRVAICDDEPLALDRLRSLLMRSGGIDIVGAFPTGESLLSEIANLRPDVVFLDVDMPRMDGFDVVDALSRIEWGEGRTPPLVIFITAHPKFAVAAFDSGALDFINKPVRLTRLEQGIAKTRVALEQLEACERLRELKGQLEELKSMYGDQRQASHIWVKRSGEAIRIPVESIRWIHSEGEYVRLHCAAETHLERASLTDLAEKLGPLGFVRIHRSTLVNAREVNRLESGQWGRAFVRLQCGEQLPIGRKYRSAMQVFQNDDVRERRLMPVGG